MLLDWEVSDEKVRSIRRSYGSLGDRYVIKANVANCNTQLDASFLGLERFYPSGVLRKAHQDGICNVAFPADGGAWSIEKSQLSNCKARLANMVLEITDIKEFTCLVRVVEQAYDASVAKAREQLRLL